MSHHQIWKLKISRVVYCSLPGDSKQNRSQSTILLASLSPHGDRNKALWEELILKMEAKYKWMELENSILNEVTQT